MLPMWVKARVKREQRQRLLEAIEVDALRSERDEPGCLRFNVLQDKQDENVFYFSGKPAFVFVHGWTCALFAPQAQHFSRRHRVVS